MTGTPTPWSNARSVGQTKGAPEGRLPTINGAPVSFSLPMPPSINAAYLNRTKAKTGRGRALSMNVVDWKMRARVELNLQDPAKVPGYCLIVTNLQRPSKLADNDNRMKLLLDLLGQEDVITDDKFVTGLAVAWAPPLEQRLHISIIPVGPLSIAFHPSDDTGAVGAWAIQQPLKEAA